MKIEEKPTWGGKRAGAGRPKGTTKNISIQRKQRQVRAFDDEWEIIKEFTKIVKKDKQLAIKMLSSQND